MPKILTPKQDFIPNRIVEVAHLFDDKLESTTTTANTANTTANSAISRLAGNDDYYEGTIAFTGTPNNFLPTSITTVSSTGITWNGGNFVFPTTGRYLVTLALSGDCNNARTDWYQEVIVRMREVVNNISEAIIFKSIPPSGIFNMESTGTVLITVAPGSQWRPFINLTPNGSTTNGLVRIRIKKVV